MATGGKSRLLSKGQLCPQPQQSEGKSFHRLRGGATCRHNTVSSDSHLETGLQWSDQCPFDCFNDNEASVPGSFCSHVFLANSWNCGSLCRDYSLVITYHHVSTWWGFRYLWPRILSTALEKELKGLDFAYLLNCYYLVSLDYFPLFLCFLTSLVKLKQV